MSRETLGPGWEWLQEAAGSLCSVPAAADVGPSLRAEASCCPTTAPRYRLWLLPPAGGGPGPSTTAVSLQALRMSDGILSKAATMEIPISSNGDTSSLPEDDGLEQVRSSGTPGGVWAVPGLCRLCLSAPCAPLPPRTCSR